MKIGKMAASASQKHQHGGDGIMAAMAA